MIYLGTLNIVQIGRHIVSITNMDGSTYCNSDAFSIWYTDTALMLIAIMQSHSANF